MGEPTTTAYLQTVGLRLRRLTRLRVALAPFHAALWADGEGAEGKRHLLTLWRPCQDWMDLLLEVLPADLPHAVRLHLLRREVEGHLLDEMYSYAALVEATDALEQVCEALLLWVEQDLNGVVEQLGEPPDEGDLR
ncbi:MAG TPA: hypothetical protein G4O00_11410 [Thermoflexia bacterium]|jgi:hypothetical protein|nr:hypothetical protein [Thermoflexia bacterium]